MHILPVHQSALVLISAASLAEGRLTYPPATAISQPFLDCTAISGADTHSTKMMKGVGHERGGTVRLLRGGGGGPDCCPRGQPAQQWLGEASQDIGGTDSVPDSGSPKTSTSFLNYK